MTKTKVTNVVKTSRGWEKAKLEPHELEYYRILRIIKRKEIPTMPIFYPNRKYFAGLSKQEIGRVKILARVERNLFSKKYTNRPWRFIRDVNLSFDFILLHHSKKTKIFKAVCDFRNDFSNQMDVVMLDRGYCCGHWYTQQARQIICSGQGSAGKPCVVPENTVYYRYQDSTYCTSCFNANSGQTIKIDDDFVLKSQFLEYFFAERQPERFVSCQRCTRKFHEVCVLYIDISGEPFFCDECCVAESIEKVPIHASKLPQTECDNFIDQFLKQNDFNTDDLLTIRLLSDVEKKIEVKKKILSYRGGVDRYPYRHFTLFTFFRTSSGNDICFFSVFFQLYEEKCPQPNRKTAYISYIDSVNLFPSKNRTKLYRLILLGLFEFLKTKGYKKIFLWSCPPKQNHDYIFYMKPPTMKMPNEERLSNWYLELFKLGFELNVVESYKEIENFANESGWKSISDVPYLEGDLWVYRMAEAAESAENEKKKLNAIVEKLKKSVEGSKTKSLLSLKKLKVDEEKLKVKSEEIKNFDLNLKVWEFMKDQMRLSSSQYFVIQLTPPEVEDSELERDKMLERSWINNRSAFVDFLWENLLEFSSERRAQFSTSVFLHRIFLESRFCVKCERKSKEINGNLLCRSCFEGVETIEPLPKKRRIPEKFAKLSFSMKIPIDRCLDDFIEVLQPVAIDSGFESSSPSASPGSESTSEMIEDEEETSLRYTKTQKVIMIT